MDRPRPRPLLLILALALAFPATASANAGTALLWVMGLHLILGNLCLGVFEGLLLAQFTRCHVWRAVLLMIPANYVSAWAGYALVGRIQAGSDITVENVSPWLTALVPAAFVITVLLEFAFVLFALRGTERPVRQAARGTLLVNGISYIPLVALYWQAGGTSFVKELRVVPAADLTPGAGYAVYYIPPEGDRVMRLDLGKSAAPEVVSSVSPPRGSAHLVRRGSPDAGFRLLIRPERDSPWSEETPLLGFSGDQLAVHAGEKDPARTTADPWFNDGPVPSFVERPEWIFRVGFWANEGIRGENKATGEKIHWSMESLIASWYIRCATHLPGDYLVFQIWRDEIFLLHAPTRRLARLARGTGPVVVKGEPLPGVPMRVAPMKEAAGNSPGGGTSSGK